IRGQPHNRTGHQIMAQTDPSRVIEFLHAYGQAKFGDEWWPGTADAHMTEAELAQFDDVWPHLKA
ncbi:hypothetical protein, partial [Mycobacterium avium]